MADEYTIQELADILAASKSDDVVECTVEELADLLAGAQTDDGEIWVPLPNWSIPGLASRPRGEKPNNAKLNKKQVRDIRKLRSEGVSKAELGRRFGVTPETISDICARRTWKHVE